MPDRNRIFSPGKAPGTVSDDQGNTISVPEGWQLLPPGDAALTRSVKAMGPTWQVQEKKGRRTFSKGVWAPGKNIEHATKQLSARRSTPEYARKRKADLARKSRKEAEYKEDFLKAVLGFLNFHPRHDELAGRLALAVTEHAIPVGSGTVARTRRIPLEDRAASAVIAWMRHKTTAYDHMRIPRVKGKRREIRKALAAASHKMLAKYRNGEEVKFHECSLQVVLRDREELP